MTSTVKVIEHTLAANGKQLITFVLRYPRFIHAELMTHRVFSRNASSSRAIPVKKMIAQVWNDPAMPIHWGANQPGMQARAELTGFKRNVAKACWRLAGKVAASIAWVADKVGLHKQVANRILEPFQYISVVLTTTEMSNWNELRAHPDAQPEIRDLAMKMIVAAGLSVPETRGPNRLYASGWHLPFITEAERLVCKECPIFLAKLSAARCARVSYLTHDGEKPSAAKDIALFEQLVGSVPLHASPTEHQGYSVYSAKSTCKNFVGFGQFRHLVEHCVFHNQELVDW
ncbi:FAD-dependent thymidylate synthase [Undibacterium sp. 5I1]|uniref:FAD-dependent thymidylate synthase n=1 Tax=unclassified Undibacterium TaxID=2630295 RepID=UPI002AB48B29|nr:MULTISPECIES: FAD-dependent thymidylate synthase [unclassified Undibacterium]MDY7537546.1 FAD-dependent thymidylate synthase [Undibacterium sp. 5I1]MEB0231930.1 FAD-dependent thymidylate synthase [Undibacterium sp. 10I3]MEB0256281.1 FAD-dependent thymidylate synthase [Undibacterium sp. 5I1]